MVVTAVVPHTMLLACGIVEVDVGGRMLGMDDFRYLQPCDP